MADNIKISDFGRPGFVKDIAEYDSVPEAWNEVRNVRFNPIGAQSFAGHTAVMSAASVPVPLWLKVFPPIDRPLWVYGDNNRLFAFDGNHNEITRISGQYSGQSNERWQGEVFQNIGIFNNVLDIPQAWLSFDAGVKLINLPNWPTDLRCRALRSFKNYLIALYMIEAGNERPYRVRWSDAADPGTVPSSWALDDPTKDSGDFDIADTSDYLVDGLGLGDLFIVYKQRTAYAMQNIGGQFIFSKDQILNSRGLLWRDCVQQFPGGHFVVGIDDIYVHTGNRGSDQSLVEARLRNWVFNQIDSSNFFNCYTVKYGRKNEYWFCFPEAGETYPTLALVWNSVTNGIGIRDIPRSPFIYPGPVDLNQGTGATWGNIPITGSGNLVGQNVQIIGEAQIVTPAEAIKVISDSQYVSLVPISSLNEITICGWARLDSTFTDIIKYLFSENNSSGNSVISLAFYNNTITISDPNSSPAAIENPNLDTWFFWAIRSSNTTNIGTAVWCYLSDTNFTANRTSTATGFGTPSSGSSDFSTFGAYKDSGGSIFSFKGDITQIRRWTTVLSDAELLAEKNSNTVVKTSSLWSSNPLQGIADISDESGNNRLAQINGTPTNVASGPGN